MPDMNWDTNEVLRWFLNDEYLYRMRKSPIWVLQDRWAGMNNKDVDVQEVDWEQVQLFFEEED